VDRHKVFLASRISLKDFLSSAVVLFELELGDAGLQHILIAGFEEIATSLNRTHKA
jgi:hypothetical protein